MTSSKSGSRAKYVQALLASTALVSAGVVLAEEGSDTQDRRSATMEEIVVKGIARKFRPDDQNTATGLEMWIIDTPQAITVLTTEMLDTVNADSVYEATDLVPNMQRNGFGFGLEKIAMRGIYNETHRINGILMDHRQTSIEAFAADRIEVVRGPATALYGVTGSFGGEMNSVLKKPQGQFGLKVSGELGSYDTESYSVDVTGMFPGSDSVKGRFLGKYDKYGLPLDISGEDFPNYKYLLMGSVEWEIGPVTTLRGTWLHQERNMDPWDGGALVENPDGSLSLPDADPEEWYFSHPDQSKETLDIEFAIAELEHHFSNGWRSKTQVAWNRWDEDLSYFYPFGSFGAYSLADDEVYIYTYDIERDGDHLTFKQSLGGDFELLGREQQFYAALEYADNGNNDEPRFQLLNSDFRGYAKMNMYADGVYDGQMPRFADGSLFLPTAPNREALFGIREIAFESNEDLRLSVQGLFSLTDKLSALAGVLYHDNESIDTIPLIRGEVQNPPIKETTDFQETVYRLGLTYDIIDYWKFVDDARIYFNYSEGFEPQTYTNADGVTVSAPQEMTQYEVGVKAEMWDGTVGASLTVFDYEITNIQVSSFFLGSFGGFAGTVLEGEQVATGVEFELIGEVLPGWNVAANYAYMDAEIRDPNYAKGYPPRTTPEHSGAIMTTYEFLAGPVAGLRVGLVLKYSGDYSYIQGPTNVDRFGYLEDGGHTRLDLNASYQPHSGPFRNAELYFRWHNVTDKDIIVAKQGNPGYGVMFIDQQTVTAGINYSL